MKLTKPPRAATATAAFVLMIAPVPAQTAAPKGSATDDAIVVAAVLERLRFGYLPSLSGSEEVTGTPLHEICLGLPGVLDPARGLLRRFRPPYQVTPLSQCPPEHHRLIVGPVRRLDQSTAEVEFSGLGGKGTFRLERRRGKWRVLGAIGGIVAFSRAAER